MSIGAKIMIVVAAIAGLAFAYWTISPLFLTREVNEELEDVLPQVSSIATPLSGQLPRNTPASPEAEIVKSGTFVGLAGHNAKGQVSLIRQGETYIIRFEDGFEVTNGPDLFVHFGNNNEYSAEARLDVLKGNIGSQNYVVPASLNPNDFTEVWIWCRAFSVPFGKATLN